MGAVACEMDEFELEDFPALSPSVRPVRAARPAGDAVGGRGGAAVAGCGQSLATMGAERRHPAAPLLGYTVLWPVDPRLLLPAVSFPNRSEFPYSRSGLTMDLHGSTEKLKGEALREHREALQALCLVQWSKLTIRLPTDLTESSEREDLGKYMSATAFPLLVLVTGQLVQMLWRLQ